MDIHRKQKLGWKGGLPACPLYRWRSSLRRIVTMVLGLALAASPVGGQKFEGSKHSGRTTPFILVLPTYRESKALIEAWNSGLGKPFDLVVYMPTPEDMRDPSRLERHFARLRIGQHAWVTPSFALVQSGDAKIPATVKWFFYDPEPWAHTPKEELENLVDTSKAIRAFCDERGMKAGITPIYPRIEDFFNLEKIAEVARYYDAYIVQAQDIQKNPTERERLVKFLRELKEVIGRVNPRCLIGVQLGAADRYGDGSPLSGVQAAMALYEATRDFVQIYTAWWEPDEQRMIELLRRMEASHGDPFTIRRDRDVSLETRR